LNFERFDSNVNLNLVASAVGDYYNYGIGINASILRDNLWGSINLSGVTNLQTAHLNVVQPQRISNNISMSGKVGYALNSYNNLIFIPYIGVGFDSSNMTFYTDNSEPIFNYSDVNLNIMGGIKPELALSKTLKLSVDTNITLEQQKTIVPNTETTLAHSDLLNSYLNITPALQINPYEKLNIELFYQYSTALTNDQITHNIIYQGYSSASIINSTLKPQNMIGINIGLLF
jgi:hypothetical protein